jgi:hypothetical protein
VYIIGRHVASLIDYDKYETEYMYKNRTTDSAVAVLLGDTAVACSGDDCTIRIYVIDTGKRGQHQTQVNEVNI